MLDSYQKPDPAFSPSDVHRHLMKSLTPKMHYTGENFSAWREHLQPKLRQSDK